MRLPQRASNKAEALTDNSAEISVRGRLVRVPALEVGGNTIVVTGRWIRTASIAAEEFLYQGLEDPELCVKKLKEHRSIWSRIDVFTFMQKLTETLPKYPYAMERQSIAAVCTRSYQTWWEELPQETRKNVRRSQKRGVVVMVEQLNDQLVRVIMGVNNESAVRQKKKFVHYGRTFEQVKHDQSTFLGRSDFICAYLGAELIGFLKLVYSGEIASIVQMLPKASHADNRPANALLAKAVEVCHSKGASYLTYGNFNYGNKGDCSLREFKIRNGFEEILIPRFLVPLTRWGTLCLKLKLHQGLLGILPPSIITMGIKTRDKCFHLKHNMGRRSSMPERPNRNRQTERSNPPAGSTTVPADPLAAWPN